MTRTLLLRGAGAICAAIALSMIWQGPADAADPTISPKETTIVGNVVKLDSGDVVIDVGAKKGAATGDVLELWRPLTVKHPVTGKLLTDRFRIGSVKISQVGEVMSLAAPQGALLRPVEAGDVVILTRLSPLAASITATASATTTSSSSTGSVVVTTAADPDAVDLTVLFDSLHATSIEVRVDAYESWVRAHEKSRFAQALAEEARELRKLLVDEGTHGPIPVGVTVTSFEAPKEVIAGRDLTLTIELSDDAVGAVVHARGADEPSYTPFPMHRMGKGYWEVTLPKARIVAPTLSFFVEAVTTTGVGTTVAGSASAPLVTKIETPPTPAPVPGFEGTFALWTDFADYNRLRGNDYAWQTEGFFGMRFGDLGLRAVRSGFGVFKGASGSLSDLDEKNRNPRSIGLTYGYVEAEWGIVSAFSVIGRAVVGLGENGVTGGGQAFVRIGNDKKTNLLIGGEILGGVGVRGITQIELNMFPRFPIMLRSEVTNQPAGTSPTESKTSQLAAQNISVEQGDLGVRAITQLGYRVTPSFVFFVRASYEGRTINHAGPGAGAGMNVTW
jgi:hypothetical protein